MNQLDPAFVLKLAKAIRPASTLSKAEHPLASQFFPDSNGVEVRQLAMEDLMEVAGGGAEFNRGVAAMYPSLGTVPRPQVAGDVSQIGARRSATVGNMAVPSSKAATVSMQKARLLEKIEATVNPGAHTGLLVEQLKAICYQLLGIPCDNLDADALKTKLTQAIKTARPDLQKRLLKALGADDREPDFDMTLEGLAALGAKIEKKGSITHISI
jgi:hypothetical protein